jgi:hypothetical protein
MGTFPATPSAGPPQPHWKTATTTPYDAAIDRTLRTAAFRATSRPRKTARMIRNARATTTPMMRGSRPATMSRKSIWAAVVPVT